MVANGGLYTNVMEKLRFEPALDESNITISVKDGGIIVLGGKVSSYAEKQIAEEAVEKVDKVRGVANELEIELIPLYERNDADIVKSALNALKWSVLIPHDQIKVAVSNGYLTLTGEVEYFYQKERAGNAVSDLYGVKALDNNIEIKATITPFQVKEKIIKEFERHARIDANNITVKVDGGTVTLKGDVRNIDEDTEAENAAKSVPGVTNVINQLMINY